MVLGPAGPPGLSARWFAAAVTTNAHAPVTAPRPPMEGTSASDYTLKRPCVTRTLVTVRSHINSKSNPVIPPAGLGSVTTPPGGQSSLTPFKFCVVPLR